MERIQHDHMENNARQEEREVQPFQGQEINADLPRGEESQRVDGLVFNIPEYQEPVQHEPEYREPMQHEPGYREPVQCEPEYREPVQCEPEYREPEYREPVQCEPEYQAEIASERELYQENPSYSDALANTGDAAITAAAAATVSIYAPSSAGQTFYQGDSVRLGANISGATWARINVYNPSGGLAYTYEQSVGSYIENYWQIASNAATGTYTLRISTLNGSTETAYATRTINVASKPVTTYYTISYYANGGSGTAPQSQTVQAGYGVNLAYNTFTRSGYTFLGWSTNSGATSAQYSGGQLIYPSGSMTLYAIWQYVQVTYYTISYYGNGGSGTAPQSQTVQSGSGINLAYNTFTRSGYTFLGWSTNSGATSAQYSAGQYINVYSNMTLYAIWQYNSSTTYYTISYYANGGSGTAPQSQTVQAGYGVNLAYNTFTRSGYTFLGWSTNSGATSAMYSGGQLIYPSGNMSLYAIWSGATQSGITLTQSSPTATVNVGAGTGGRVPVTITAPSSGNVILQGTAGTSNDNDPALYNASGTRIAYQNSGYNFTYTISAGQTVTVYAGTGGNVARSYVISSTWPSALPAAPTGLTVTNQTTNSIYLAWNGVSGATYYDVYQGSTYLGYITAPSTSCVINNLTSGTSYSFYIKARNSSGSSGNSNTVTGTTLPNASMKFYPPSIDTLTKTDICLSSTQTKKLSFTKTGRKLIFCNHPESLSSSIAFLGDNGKYLNRVDLSAGEEALVYAAYQNYSSYNFTFGIELTNLSSNQNAVTLYNSGFSTGTGVWDTMPGDVWKNYVNNNSSSVIYLNGNEKLRWIMEKSVKVNEIFNAIQYLKATYALRVTVYAYINKNLINGSETFIPQSGLTLSSGWMETSLLSANYNLKASELGGNGIYHKIFDFNSGNSGEMFKINRVQGGSVEPSAQNNGLIGNWGVQYNFNVSLVNDDPVNSKKFIGFLGTNPSACCIAVQQGPNFAYKMMRGVQSALPQGVDIDTGIKANYSCWKWIEYIVPKSTTVNLAFTIFHGANGSAPGAMQWKAENA